VILHLTEFQQYCLKNHVAFVSYSLPGAEQPVTLYATNNEVRTYQNISDIQETSGFLLSPFQSEDFPVIVIPDVNLLTGWSLDLTELPHHKELIERQSGNENPIPNSQPPVTFEQYSNQVESIKKSILNGEAQKVVLSRTKSLKGIEEHHVPSIFEELAHRYTNAFVYVIYTPASGVWIGATPETLIRTDQQSFSTMALAGTKPFSDDPLPPAWAEKELKEHRYVVDYVRQKLLLGRYAFREYGTETVRAGNVMHLRTLFNGLLQNNPSDWKELVTLLYPTPAICGTENEATLQLIRKTEKHKRHYYTGIIGPFNETAGTNLFINLRCMNVTGNTALLYAGGGILGESSAQKEWDETELKFNTLIQVIRQVAETVKE
jgi:isochorismate synthases